MSLYKCFKHAKVLKTSHRLRCMVVEADQGFKSVWGSYLKEGVASTTGSGVVVAKCQPGQVQNDVALIITQTAGFAKSS